MNCKNCNTILNDARYCPKCGGKVIKKRLTLKNLFEHVSETFFNYDNKLLRTFLDLFRRPENVIVGYINGVRKKYVNVFSYFALALTISGLQIFILQKFQTELTFYDTSTEMGKRQQAIFDVIYKFTNEYQSLVMMLYIPIYALIAKLVFLKTKMFNYVETLVIFLYTQAQFSICIGLLTVILIPLKIIDFASLGMLLMLVQVVYFIYSLKRIYALSNFQMFLRTLIFVGIMGFLFIIITLIGVIIAFKTGMMDQMIEAQKAAKDSLQ